MDGDTPSPSRREFIVGTAGVGAAGLGIGPSSGEARAEDRNSADTSGRVDAVVRFEPADDAGVEALKRHARDTRRAFERFAAGRSDVSIERRFWAANAVLASVDLGSASREAILEVDGVTAVHPNCAGRVFDSGETSSAAATGAGDDRTEQQAVTYPLSEVDVPEAWEVHDARGEGVDVAVIDTGIDTSGHEGLAASLKRGGWAEFDENGDPVDSDPHDPIGHGTAVSSLVAGGTNDDGDGYSIAPAVNLYVARNMAEPPEGIRLLSAVAGIEWVIEQEVDVLTMSLGFPLYNEAFVEPVRNAMESGILVVAGAGNSGRYTGLSPSNIPGVLSVGGIDDDRALYDDSSGERVETERYWGDDVPGKWPREYSVPDVAAPAVDVPSARPEGGFGADRSGTSFAAPCVAAVAALAVGATDANAEAVRTALVETARHPAAEDAFDVDPGRDERFGQGVVTALGAISHLRASETVSGTVTDGSGSPLDGVTVASEAGLTTETDDRGRYELTLPPVTQPVGATGVGFDTTVARLDPAETDTWTFELARTDELDVEMTGRMPTRIDPGEQATATFDAANVETVTVELDVTGPFDPEGLELTVDGTSVEFGDPVAVGADRTQITVGVTVPEEFLITEFRARYEFTGSDASVGGAGHPVHAHPDPLTISPSDPPDLQTPVDLMAPRTTLELTDGRGVAVARPDDDAGVVIDKPLTLTAADGTTPRVEFSNEGADAPAAVLVSANDVTVSGLVVKGEGAETGVQVGRPVREAFGEGAPWPSGVTVRGLSVSGATTAIHSYHAPALRITDNEVTAEATGIGVAGRADVAVRGNDLTGVETGIAATRQVGAIADNSLSDVDGTGILVATPRFLSRHWGQEIGPVRSNTVTGANRGIVVEGVTTLPVEENDLSDIDDTAIVVEGGVLAPVRANSVENAATGIAVADDAEVTAVRGNEFTDVRNPGDGVETATPEGGRTGDGTDSDAGTASPKETGPAPTDGTPSGDDADPATDGVGGPDSNASGPGLGIGSALAGLGGAGYLLGRRLTHDGTESE